MSKFLSAQRLVELKRYNVVLKQIASAFLKVGCVTEMMTVAITATRIPKCAVSAMTLIISNV